MLKYGIIDCFSKAIPTLYNKTSKSVIYTCSVDVCTVPDTGTSVSDMRNGPGGASLQKVRTPLESRFDLNPSLNKIPPCFPGALKPFFTF